MLQFPLQKISRMNTSSQDSQLPIEILVTILLKSSLLDRIRAGAVCYSWWSALKEIKAHKLHPPWLLLSKNFETDNHRVLDLSNNTIYDGLHIPEAHEVFYLGSFDGWLILLKWSARELFLLNPSSKEKIKLPRRAEICNLSKNYPIEDFGQHYEIAFSTAILSSAPTSNDCVVLIMHDESKLSFCRLGDATWTVLAGLPFHDIAFYKGHFYAIKRKGNLTIPKFIGPNDLPLNLVEIEKRNYRVDEAYLVESCGELLMVLRFRATKEFRIFKMDSSGRFSVKVESLGDQILFVGRSCSKSFSAIELPGFEKNCICFKDGLGHDFSVFHMEDGSIKPCFRSWYYSGLCSFIWLKS